MTDRESVAGSGRTQREEAETTRPTFARKSILVAMASAVGVGLAGAVQPHASAAGTDVYVPIWRASADYAAGQQVVNPANDVVAARATHLSSAAYATDQAKWTLSSTEVFKAVQPINVKAAPYGAVGDGSTDDTAALTVAIADAVSSGRALYVPAGIYVTGALVVKGASDFQMHMTGRFKRPSNSARNPILWFSNCVRLDLGAINTDGNAANNGYAGITLDELKPDVSIINCAGVLIDSIDSVNPAGDTLYIGGTTASNTKNVQIGTVSSISDGYTGRQAVTIIKATNVQIDKILSINTGHPGQLSPAKLPMPGGFAIEPNEVGDVVNNVHIGSLIVRTAGSTGFSLYSTFGRIITNVTVGRINIEKTSGVLFKNTSAVIVRGAQHVQVGTIRAALGGYCGGASVADADDVRLDLHLTDSAGVGLTLGSPSVVSNFRLTGSIVGTTSHSIVVYDANDGTVDMTLKNQGVGTALVIKSTGGTSRNVTFRGDWTKGTTGTFAMQATGATGITDWVLDGVNMTGYGPTYRVRGGACLQSVARLNCRGLNFGTSIPKLDTWHLGDVVWNSAPAAGGAPAWICVVAGAPGTWKAMGSLSA